MHPPEASDFEPDEVAALRADIAAAEAVAQTLPDGSPDRFLIEDTIARLHLELTSALAADGIRGD